MSVSPGFSPFAFCASEAVVESGAGVRFELPGTEGPVAAFAIRHAGTVRAYLNQCAHIPVELDWTPGNFFDDQGQYLICATHGATYTPQDGRCIAGPCRGRSLVAVPCFDRDGWVGAGLRD
ncbi:MAG: Rieske (2Fe-2S) protein [Betaproteobacteria bacterium]